MAENNAINYDILDEDTLSSDSATSVATQQSLKAYTDSAGGGIYEYITTTEISTAVSEVAFTNLSSDYFFYDIYMFNVNVDGAGDNRLRTQLSDDNGSTWLSGSNSYYEVYMSPVGSNSNDQSYLSVAQTDTTTYTGVTGVFRLYNPTDSGSGTIFSFRGMTGINTDPYAYYTSGGVRHALEDNDAIRFYSPGRNLDNGNFVVYGCKAS